MENNLLTRYSEITEKNPREIVLLRGSGCKWRRCTFCDYHLDFSLDEEQNFILNAKELSKVTGKYAKLEVINSGSFVDLDKKTLSLILDTCICKNINEIHFECHWMHKESVPELRQFFAKHNIITKIKIGVETFHHEYRENILCKGIDVQEPQRIAEYFDEVCLLFGLNGQTSDSMQHDIETGLSHFERVCINIMVKNSTAIKPNAEVIHTFMKNLYPLYIDNPRIDILLENTDYGVG